MVPLLTSSIPNFKLHGCVVHRQRLREERRADRRFLPLPIARIQSKSPNYTRIQHELTETIPGIREIDLSRSVRRGSTSLLPYRLTEPGIERLRL